MSQRRGFSMPHTNNAGSSVLVTLDVGQRIQSIKMVRRRIIAHPAQREGFGSEIAETYPDALRGWKIDRLDVSRGEGPVGFGTCAAIIGTVVGITRGARVDRRPDISQPRWRVAHPHNYSAHKVSDGSGDRDDG